MGFWLVQVGQIIKLQLFFVAECWRWIEGSQPEERSLLRFTVVALRFLHLTDRHITSSLFLIAVFKKNKRRKIASRRSRVFHSLALQNTLFRSLGNNLAFFASPVNSYQSQCFFLFCFFLMYFQLNAWYEVYVEHKHHTLQLSTHAWIQQAWLLVLQKVVANNCCFYFWRFLYMLQKSSSPVCEGYLSKLTRKHHKLVFTAEPTG